VKDGCAPQGQCGCCTVLVDGLPRVSCVTPVSRVAGRAVTTLEGVDPPVRDSLIDAFDRTAASQCGFCTPGILCRLAALGRKPRIDDAAVRGALSAHLCRCTGFQPIVEAALVANGLREPPPARDHGAATARATLESGTTQVAGPEVARGLAPFADDTAPPGAVVALCSGTDDYSVAPTIAEARRIARVVQGRNSTIALTHPVALPDGSFDVVLQTTWVEPAYLEPDASWCEPGGDPASPFGNAGAFGAKRHSPAAGDAQRLAGELGGPVRVLWTREAVVRRGEKRPPLSLGVNADGSGVVRVGWTGASRPVDPVVAAIVAAAPGLDVTIEPIAGPPVGTTHRGAGVAEVLAALAIARVPLDARECTVTTPNGATATVRVAAGRISVVVAAGDPLCEATLRSFVIGAVHQGFSMVTTEGIAVDERGVPVDLTIRSFGITPARSFPHVDVTLESDDRQPLAAGTAVFAATLAAMWLSEGRGPRWPTRR